MDLHRIESYILDTARPLDLMLYKYLLGRGSKKKVLEQLASYQNEDGGFGHGIEPDMQSSASTALSTSVAFQYLAKLDFLDDPLFEKAVSYLEKTYSESHKGWVRIVPEIGDAPHAPWWNYDEKKLQTNWPNPTVEIVAYLNRYSHYLGKDFLLDMLNQEALDYLQKNKITEVHDLLCYKRFYDFSSDSFRKSDKEKLFDLIEDVVENDSSKWGSYVPRPLDFINSPKDELTQIFSKELIVKNLEYLGKSLISEDHWEPTWNWGVDSEDWEKAKKEWSGILTINNLLKLQSFGVQVC